MKVIRIKNCSECPYEYVIFTGNPISQCINQYVLGQKDRLTPETGIREDCPLEDETTTQTL